MNELRFIYIIRRARYICFEYTLCMIACRGVTSRRRDFTRVRAYVHACAYSHGYARISFDLVIPHHLHFRKTKKNENHRKRYGHLRFSSAVVLTYFSLNFFHLR